MVTSYCESLMNTVIAHAGSLTQVTLLLPGANNAHTITINSWWTVTCLCIWNSECFWKSYHMQNYILGHINNFFNPAQSYIPTCFSPFLGSSDYVLWPTLSPHAPSLREKPKSTTKEPQQTWLALTPPHKPSSPDVQLILKRLPECILQIQAEAMRSYKLYMPTVPKVLLRIYAWFFHY